MRIEIVKGLSPQDPKVKRGFVGWDGQREAYVLYVWSFITNHYEIVAAQIEALPGFEHTKTNPLEPQSVFVRIEQDGEVAQIEATNPRRRVC